MSDGFWVLAYILAGIINVMGVFKFYEWLYEHDMNQSEKRDYELMNSAMSAHPGFKALLCLLLWVFWPLISLICIRAVVKKLDGLHETMILKDLIRLLNLTVTAISSQKMGRLFILAPTFTMNVTLLISLGGNGLSMIKLRLWVFNPRRLMTPL